MAAARPAIVGGFVLGGLAIAVAAILFFGGSRLLEPTAHAVIFFEGSVAGLDIGAPVTFRGVRVGSVKRVALELSASGRARIPVTIELLPDRVTMDVAQGEKVSLERLVASGLRAQLNLQSFVTGQLQVDLDIRPGTPAVQVAADTGGLPQIPSLPSDLERLRMRLAELPLPDLIQNAGRFLATAERLAEHIDAALGPLLEKTGLALDTATRTLNTTDQAVAQVQSDASRSLQGLDALTADARVQLDDRSADLRRILQTTDRATRHAEAVLASLDGLTGPRAQFRDDLQAAARDLAASAGSLRGFARALERDPSVLLRGTRAP